MSFRILTENERNILVLLVFIKEASKYELYQEALKLYKMLGEKRKPSYSSIHNGVNSLLKKELIEVTKTEPSKKNQKINVEYYTLTYKGLCTIIFEESANIDKNFNFLNKLIENWSDKLPLTLGKWKVFKEHGLENEAIDALLSSASTLLLGYYSTEILRKNKQEIIDSLRKIKDDFLTLTVYGMIRKSFKTIDPKLSFEYHFYKSFFDLYLTYYVPFKTIFRNEKMNTEGYKILRRFLDCFKSDPEIKDFVIKILQGDMEMYNAIIKEYEFILQEINKE